MKTEYSQPAGTGFGAALVGYTSSFVVVLAGLQAVGATPAQATVGLMALTILQGVLSLWLSFSEKIPLMAAWSTPGAAILVSSAAVAGGWPAAVGAFLTTGILIMLTGLWPLLGRIIAAIPPPLAQAMLAGVLLTLCVQPVTALAGNPLFVAPVILFWVFMMRFAPRLATPLAFLLTLVIIAGVIFSTGAKFSVPAPTFAVTIPTFSLPAIIGISIPLYIVTMASQNVPGVAVMAAHGYRVPWRKSLLTTGAGTAIVAPFGGHTLNLAAITAAMTASAQSHSDPKKRWIGVAAAGVTYIVLGLFTPLLTAAVSFSPEGLIETVAGLALVTTMVAALAEAFKDSSQRIATGITFLIAASPVAIFGIGAAFWGLLAGLIIWWLFRNRKGL